MSEANDWTAGSTNMRDVLEGARKMIERSRAIPLGPNGLVMTRRVCDRLRGHIESFNGASGSPVVLDRIYGVPIHCYDTVKQCLDRMMLQSNGERFLLVLDEDIPGDCQFHPWCQEQKRKMLDRLCGKSVGGVPFILLELSRGIDV